MQELKHKARRQDVLVADKLILAFYAHKLPADVSSGAALDRCFSCFRDEARAATPGQPPLLQLTRDE